MNEEDLVGPPMSVCRFFHHEVTLTLEHAFAIVTAVRVYATLFLVRIVVTMALDTIV